MEKVKYQSVFYVHMHLLHAQAISVHFNSAFGLRRKSENLIAPATLSHVPEVPRNISFLCNCRSKLTPSFGSQCEYSAQCRFWNVFYFLNSSVFQLGSVTKRIGLCFSRAGVRRSGCAARPRASATSTCCTSCSPAPTRICSVSILSFYIFVVPPWA